MNRDETNSMVLTLHTTTTTTDDEAAVPDAQDEFSFE
jgi:hypothetical protein